MIESLAEHRRLKAHEEVNFYLKSTGRDVEFLFVLAYQAYFSGSVDVYEIRANLDRYRLTQDPPPYVRAFLHRKIQ